MAEVEDVIRVQGTVVETLPNAQFKVEIDGGLGARPRVGRGEDALHGSSPVRRRGVRLRPLRGRIVWRGK